MYMVQQCISKIQSFAAHANKKPRLQKRLTAAQQNCRRKLKAEARKLDINADGPIAVSLSHAALLISCLKKIHARRLNPGAIIHTLYQIITLIGEWALVCGAGLPVAYN